MIQARIFFSFFKARASEASIRWTGAQHPARGFFWRTGCSAGAQRSPICSTGVGLMSYRQILDGLVPKLSCLELESSSYLWRPQNARGSRKGQQLGILSVWYQLGTCHKELLKPRLEKHKLLSCPFPRGHLFWVSCQPSSKASLPPPATTDLTAAKFRCQEQSHLENIGGTKSY